MNDHKFFKAFYHVLKDTLVTETLERAKQIGYGRDRRRVITESGVLIQKEGTMTGGGGRPRPRRIMESFDQAELDQVNKELTELVNQINTLRDEIRRIQREIQDLDPNQIRAQYNKAEVDFNSYNDSMRQLQEKLAQLQNVKISDEDLEHVKELEDKINDLEPEHQKWIEEAKEAKKVCDEIQKKIQNAGGPEYQNMKKAVEKMQKDIGSKNKLVAQMEQQTVKQDNIMKQADKSFKDSQAEYEEIIQKKNKLQQKKKK